MLGRGWKIDRSMFSPEVQRYLRYRDRSGWLCMVLYLIILIAGLVVWRGWITRAVYQCIALPLLGVCIGLTAYGLVWDRRLPR